MRLRANEATVCEDDPFAYDELGIRDSADALMHLVKNSHGGGVVAVDAPWGFGKTTFLKMWTKHAENEGAEVVFFNAWQNDHMGDPLVALSSELEKKIKNKDSYEHFSDELKRLAGKAATHAVPLAVKVATSGLIDLKETGLEGFDKALSNFASEQVDEYVKAKNDIKNLKDLLQRLSGEIAEHSEIPLIFVVDELDRCRPTYAVETLEIIKHVFDVEGIAFVMGLHFDQLASSVNGIYGESFDSFNYLTRFFHINMALPEPSRDKVVDMFVEGMEIGGLFEDKKRVHPFGSKKQLINNIKWLSEVYDLSLREVQRAVSILGVYISSVSEGKVVFPYAAAFFAIAKIKDPSLYSKIKRGDVDESEVWRSVQEKNIVSGEEGKRHVYLLRCEIIMVLEGASKLKSIAQQEKSDSGEQKNQDYLIEYARRVMESMNPELQFRDRGFKDYVFSRVELLRPLEK